MTEQLMGILGVWIWVLGTLALIAFCTVANIIPGDDIYGECAVGAAFAAGFGFFLAVISE